MNYTYKILVLYIHETFFPPRHACYGIFTINFLQEVVQDDFGFFNEYAAYINIVTDQPRTAIITHESIYLGPTAQAVMSNKALDTLVSTFDLIDT